MSPVLEIILILAFYLLGRIHQFVQDARSVMGTAKKKYKNRQ
jgi:hypothetical protein